MKRKRRKLVAIICALTLALSSAVPVMACTPPLKPPSVEIPDIHFEPDDALKEAFDNAAKNWIEKCILGSPTVEYASYYKSASRYWSYGILNVKWDPIEDATSYEVCITKEDGAEKVFTTTYNSLFVSDRFDDFVANGMDGATVKVKAYGDNDTFGCWSYDANIVIARFGY
jgi:hypothetical protein